MPGTLQIEIVKASQLTVADRVLWRAMVEANRDLASPYFAWEFTEIASRIVPQAAVAILTRDGRTIGYFPHQRRGSSIQPLGAPMNDYHGVIAMPGDAPPLAEVAELLGAPRLSVSAWVGPSGVGAHRETLMTVLPEEGYDAWYAERRRTWGKYFKDKERARRSLETELGQADVKRGLTDPAMLDHLIGLKRDQYARTSRHDIFACGWTRDLLHALMASEYEGFGASMAALWAGGKLTAIEYSLHAGDRYHFWFPAYEPGLARCSPGILLTMDTMRLGAEAGFRVFDFGFGGEGYKKYFCNATQAVREAVVLRPGMGSLLSDAAFGLLNTAAGGRGERLRTSVRRRWAAIEACEVTPANRLKGAAAAAVVAVRKATGASHAA
ncbi:MAG: GNAT family N-acetyltransferase [Alphaproteobacteria bacterium]|nr:GNAT family N-acetyltransferase [Alphaproteobacteria bacterium]